MNAASPIPAPDPPRRQALRPARRGAPTLSRSNDFCLLASQSRSHFRRRNQTGKKHTLVEIRAILGDKLWAKRVG